MIFTLWMEVKQNAGGSGVDVGYYGQYRSSVIWISELISFYKLSICIYRRKLPLKCRTQNCNGIIRNTYTRTENITSDIDV